MIEIVPKSIDSIFLYFHGAASSSQEFLPYLKLFKIAFPSTFIWAGNGPIACQPNLRSNIQYSNDKGGFWFTFPMQDASSVTNFQNNIEPMGAVLTSCGAYINLFVDSLMEEYKVPASRVVLCGYQHGSCVALAATMMRKMDPFSLAILFDPFPLETYYLKSEKALPKTKIVSVTNSWGINRNRSMINDNIDDIFQSYGMNIDSIHIDKGGNKVDEFMMQAAIKIMHEQLS